MSTQEPDSDSRTEAQSSKHRLEQLLPMISAADAGRKNRVRVRFDEHIAEMIKTHARERSLSVSTYPDRDYRNHLLGFASEVAVATWLDGDVDMRVLDDYEGDDGVDVKAPAEWGTGQDRIQVKATKDIENPERTIERSEISEIDHVVLACSDIPERYIEIVGYTTRQILKLTDDAYGRNGPILQQEALFPMHGQLYAPADVRDAVGSVM